MTSKSTDIQRLERAYHAMRKMRERLERLEMAQREPIAVIAMSCRFPGGADDPDAFWELLQAERDTVTEVPADRWDAAEYYDPDPDAAGKTYCSRGSFLSGIDMFDPDFFGLSRMEARSMDPQHRLALETAWRTLEQGGYSRDRLRTSLTGVFVGITAQEYSLLLLRRDGLNAFYGGGNPLNAAAGRISHTFGLQGPSMAIDTACSSSLVAVHLACESLRRGECHQALAGGVNVTLLPEGAVILSRARMLAVDGRCKTFDAAADGYVRGEGCGMLLLKRLADAQAAGDRIRGVILGSAVNHDGPSNGFTAPNGRAQQQVIRQALSQAGISPEDIDYVEAHGTGTSLGDPIEIQALHAVLGPHRTPEQPLIVGSVKTNLGHLESAAGMAGLIKTILAIEHAGIPAHLHFKTPNPLIPWSDMAIRIPVKATAWPEREGRRIAGVSGFGAGGTNAHVIVAQAPTMPAPADDISTADRPLHPLILSARSEADLKQLARDTADMLAASPDMDSTDLCFSTNTGRTLYPFRLAVIGANVTEFILRLRAFAADQPTEQVFVSHHARNRTPRVAFLFTPLGPRYLGLIRALLDTSSAFRKIIDRYEQTLQRVYGSLSLHPPGSAVELHPAAVFAYQCAVSDLLLSWGVTPTIASGIQLGGVAAGYVAGCLGVEDGLRLAHGDQDAVAKLRLHPARASMVESRDGDALDAGTLADPAYWTALAASTANADNGQAALAGILDQGADIVWIIGESTPLSDTAGTPAADGAACGDPSEPSPWLCLLRGLAETALSGGPIDWMAFDAGTPRRRVPLPPHPMHRQRYWVDPAPPPKDPAELTEWMGKQLEDAGRALNRQVESQLNWLAEKLNPAAASDPASAKPHPNEIFHPGPAAGAPVTPTLVYMFSGLGDQYVNMAAGLFKDDPLFREHLDQCRDRLRPLLDTDLYAVLFDQAKASKPAERSGRIDLRRMLNRNPDPEASPASSELDRPRYAHSALFAVEYALAQRWLALGQPPDAMLGFSLGEYVAACLAGVMSLDAALQLVVKRAELIETMPDGRMLAVPLSETRLQPYLNDDLFISAYCTPSVCVVSGRPDAVAGLETRLQADGIVYRPLRARHAFHSPLLAAIEQPLERMLAAMTLHPPRIPCLSNITGDWMTPDQAVDPAFWARHALAPVRFADQLAVLLEQPNRMFLEIGPGSALGSFVVQHPRYTRRHGHGTAASLRNADEAQDDTAFLERCLKKIAEFQNDPTGRLDAPITTDTTRPPCGYFGE